MSVILMILWTKMVLQARIYLMLQHWMINCHFLKVCAARRTFLINQLFSFFQLYWKSTKRWTAISIMKPIYWICIVSIILLIINITFLNDICLLENPFQTAIHVSFLKIKTYCITLRNAFFYWPIRQFCWRPVNWPFFSSQLIVDETTTLCWKETLQLNWMGLNWIESVIPTL